MTDYSNSHTPEEASRKFDVPLNVVQSWLVQDMDEVKLRFHIQQKFYNLIPLVEAKITAIYSESDFIVCGISDEEWDECSNRINKVITETISKVYRAVMDDPVFLEHKKKPKPKKIKPSDPYQDLPFLPGFDSE